MKKLLLIAMLFFTFKGYASKIIVSQDIGYNITNSTSFLQEAFNTVTDTIIIDNVGTPWITAPIYLNNSNVTVILEQNVEVLALTGAYSEFDSMFRIWDVENIVIEGYGATIKMNKQEYIDLNDSEFRHAFNLGSATNITIKGLHILDTGGDGILISKSFDPNSTKNYCENITIKDCTLDNNYRQGISVVSIKNGTISNCILSNTNGTLPEAGIDIEPDDPSERIENLTISKCRFFNNNGNGLQLTTFFMDSSSIDISVIIENCYFSSNFDLSNEYSYAEMAFYDNEFDGTGGNVLVRNCFIENSDWTAVNIKKTIESYNIVFDTCVFKNISQNPIGFNNPIFFEVTNFDEQVPRFGGANFFDCIIHYDANIPFLSLIENETTSDGLGNVTGNFFIISPNDNGFESGANSNNVNISYIYLNEAPNTEISIEANQNEYFENNDIPIQYTLSRTTDNAIPLAVNLESSGSATYGLDFSLHQNFNIFGLDENSISDTIDIIQDNLTESPEILTMEIFESECYDISANNTIDLTIFDDEMLGISSFSKNSISIVPNPASQSITIESNIQNGELYFYDVMGKLVKVDIIKNFSAVVAIDSLESGFYLVALIDSLSKQKIIKKLIVK